ncbi:MAG: hypothetical protein KBF12_09835 [Sebaldella sp.]|nr:hypothetical protein [Sebaldella sp.]
MNYLRKLFFAILLSISLLASPIIIPHRGGTGEMPENTIFSYEKSVTLGLNILEIDVQVTKDDQIVLYHPRNLEVSTNGNGLINDYVLKDIKKLDAAYKFKVDEEYLYRNKGLTIPTLRETLNKFPKTTFIIDMKSLPSDKLVKALISTIKTSEWKRLIFYSTNSEHINLLKSLAPQAITFEERNKTRERLLNILLDNNDLKDINSDWIGFDYNRKMTIGEEFALGTDSNDFIIYPWNEKTVSALKKLNPNVKIVVFGVETIEDYNKMDELGIYAIYTNFPNKLKSALKN